MASFLLENAMKNDTEKEMLIDLGYLEEEKTQKRHQKLLAFGIGKNNFCYDGMARLIMKCPKSKTEKIFKTFPIKEGGGYWQTTHHWADDTGGEPCD